VVIKRSAEAEWNKEESSFVLWKYSFPETINIHEYEPRIKPRKGWQIIARGLTPGQHPDKKRTPCG